MRKHTTLRSPKPDTKTRRQALKALGGAGVGVLLGCSQTSGREGLGQSSGPASAAGTNAAGLPAAGAAAGASAASAGASAASAGPNADTGSVPRMPGGAAGRMSPAGSNAAGGASAPSASGAGDSAKPEAGSAAMSAGGTSGASSAAGSSASPAAGSGASEAAGSGATVDPSECMLTAEQEEGPFYVAMPLVRSDITDGKQGSPLAMTFTIMNVKTCKPLANAAVDIWHCDYTGAYSDAMSQPARFHRGVQITDAMGQVRFTTVYPGWYNGRTVHVHIKVHVGGMASGMNFSGGHVSHTGNVFFPQETNDAVAVISPYQGGDHNNRTLNAQDHVLTSQNGGKYVCKMSGMISAGAKLEASITLGVDPDATPALIGIHH